MTNPLITAGMGAGPSVSPNGDGGPSAQFSTAVTVDGTPMRVVLLGVSAALGLYALRQAGFKFNVGVS